MFRPKALAGLPALAAVALLAVPEARAQRGADGSWAANVVVPQATCYPIGRPEAVRIERVRAGIVIKGQMATTMVEVALRNPTGARLEAELLMPVPDGAVVRGFSYAGSAAGPSARVLPRDEARRTYDRIVAQAKDPALLEFSGYNLVRSSVFPVEPNGTQAVRLTYEHLLTSDGERVDYVLPRSESVEYRVPWTISAQVEATEPIAAVYSPSHPIRTTRPSAKVAMVVLEKDSATDPGPFRLSYLKERDGVSASLFAYPDPRVGGGYFLLLAGLPPAPKEKSAEIRRDVTLVIDRSGSMRGEKLDQVREAARQVIAGLDEGESFNVILYNEGVDPFAAKPVRKSRETEREVNRFLDEMSARGGTNIHDALLESLRPAPLEGTLPIVLFMTDGLPTVGQTAESAIRDLARRHNPHRKRVFSFGVGVDVNTPLLEKIAYENRGFTTFILPAEDVEVKVGRVFDRLKGPVLADPELTAVGDGPRRVSALIPDRLPDLFEGDQIVLVGKYRGDEPLEFTLRGNYRGMHRTLAFRLPVSGATTRNGFVPRLWASRKIGLLVDAIRSQGAEGSASASALGAKRRASPVGGELVDEIVRLSTEFGILTEYTAFLAREGTDLDPQGGPAGAGGRPPALAGDPDAERLRIGQSGHQQSEPEGLHDGQSAEQVRLPRHERVVVDDRAAGRRPRLLQAGRPVGGQPPARRPTRGPPEARDRLRLARVPRPGRPPGRRGAAGEHLAPRRHPPAHRRATRPDPGPDPLRRKGKEINMARRQTRWRPSVAVVATTALLLSAVPRLQAQAPPGRPEARGASRRPVKQGVLDLEDALLRAELVVVVRLVDMTEAKIVHGGKTEVVTQQFRFEPVRTVKGIFAREALLLTGQDLGIYRFGESADRLERGQLLLLTLGRQGPGYFNCNTAGSLEQSIPRLGAADDPLVGAVQALIAVGQRRDRAEKVETTLAALRRAKDREAVPLMFALQRRSALAAQAGDAADVVAKFLTDTPPEVREVAARTLGSILDADYLKQGEMRDRAVKALVAGLDAAGPDLAMRVAALDALGSAGEAAGGLPGALPWLKADRPASTFREHAARLRAIGRTGRAEAREGLASFLEGLPFDAPDDVQVAAGEALGRLDPKEAAKHLANRLANKSDAGLGVASEINLIGSLPREVAVPALLEAFSRVERADERLAFASACVRVADPRLVPTLASFLDPRDGNIRYQATEALRRIDTDEAASVLWPHLAQEADLLRKLQIAAFLGRHGFRGGYPYAIEHMSVPQLQDAAVEALAAIREPKAVPELRKIWESSNDLGWNAAAIRALGRLGQADIAPRLLQIAADRRSPLAAPSLIALGDLGEVKAIPIALEGLNSRSDEVVIASIRAARKLVKDPALLGSDAVRDRLAALVSDPDASPPVRATALEALVALKDRRLGPSLAAAARDGALEGSELLRRIEQLLADRREKLDTK